MSNNEDKEKTKELSEFIENFEPLYKERRRIMKDILLLVDRAIMDYNIEGRKIGPIDKMTKLELAERILTKISNEMKEESEKE
ncbi:MAG TPA: hypothetical protein VEP90_05105 [Methylomirabilota bacterium]|nr:hypothetical protein [Methylomirabilota bacterium]